MAEEIHSPYFEAGKLPAEMLQRFLREHTVADARVIVGPGIGLDAAAIRFNDRVLIAKTDPITFASDEIGWYAVHVNANDIACLGGTPKWFLATILLPQNQTDEALVQSIFKNLHQACEDLGVTLVGGHTEITTGLDRPIISGSMLGEASEHELLDIRTCRPEDRLVLASGIAVEAVSIIARVRGGELLDIFDDEFITRCQNFIHQPGISVVRAARIARQAARVRAMHDPTEGGLATALHEIADASGCGFQVQEELIPMWPEAKVLCEHFGLDILGVISSGALLIVVPQEEAEKVVAGLQQQGIEARDLGYLTDNSRERLSHQAGGEAVALPRFDRDEIARLF